MGEPGSVQGPCWAQIRSEPMAVLLGTDWRKSVSLEPTLHEPSKTSSFEILY